MPPGLIDDKLTLVQLMVLSGNKLLFELMLSLICVTIC